MSRKITVFTPTFNRAYCLGQLYESLVKQTNKDFLWLIVDDGSSDNTEALVNQWTKENKIEIQYIFQQNGGMHSAHNTAYANIDTELNVCIDSDDFMPADAIANILNTWKEKGGDSYAGIIGLDVFKSGQIIGTAFPDGVKEATMTDLYQKHRVTGDKKVVLRTAVVREFPPYPIFKEERLVPLGTLYKMIDQSYRYICMNDVYCIVEYLADGSSNSIFKQYRKSPNGFLYARLLEMRYSENTFYTFTRAIHLVSSSLFARKYNIFKSNPNMLLTMAAAPFGLAWHAYILMKTRK
jgi:glycosyltransferase involved in cell wall biosynthesis